MTVYILQSLKDRRYYIGSTYVISERLKQHNNGQVKSTKGRRPFVLVYFENYETVTEARKRENQIKRMKGGIQFKNLINSRG